MAYTSQHQHLFMDKHTTLHNTHTHINVLFLQLCIYIIPIQHYVRLYEEVSTECYQVLIGSLLLLKLPTKLAGNAGPAQRALMCTSKDRRMAHAYQQPSTKTECDVCESVCERECVRVNVCQVKNRCLSVCVCVCVC